MACFESGKRIRVSSAGTANDIISHLPVEIKQKILTQMPIKDAIRTTVLSTKWMGAWESIPEIVVREEDLIPDVDRAEAGSDFVEIVDVLLFQHSGPILKFYFSMKNPLHHCPEAFDRWIGYFKRNEISELTFLLNFTSNTRYKIPSKMFFSNTLQHVELSRCLLKLPRDFEGLKLLKTLQLNDCIISGADIEHLVSTSPQLVKLILENIKIEGVIRIYATGLTNIKLLGTFSDFQIDAPNLNCASIACSDNNHLPERTGSINNIFQSLGSLLKIQGIYLLGFSIPYLVDKPPAGLLKAFNSLNWTDLEVDIADQKENSFLLLLLQNATHLQHLSIFVRASESTSSRSFWEKYIVLKHLEMVSIQGFVASEPVLSFVKFILGSAPLLKTLSLFENGDDRKEENIVTYKRLLSFPRASPKAKIIVA